MEGPEEGGLGALTIGGISEKSSKTLLQPPPSPEALSPISQSHVMWESCGGRGVGDEKNLGAPNASEDAPIRKQSGSHIPSSKSQSASPALPSPNPDAESQNRAHPPEAWPGIGDQALTQRLCIADAA